MKNTLLVLGLLVLSSCGSMPHTVDAFREMAHDSSMVQKTEFRLKNTKLTEAKARIEKMAKQCYAMKVKNVLSSNTGVSVVEANYNPTLQESPQRLALSLQRECTRGCGPRFPEPPKAGDWVFLVDIVPDGKSDLKGEMYTVFGGGMIYGDFVEDTIAWLQNGKKLCPELK